MATLVHAGSFTLLCDERLQSIKEPVGFFIAAGQLKAIIAAVRLKWEGTCDGLNLRPWLRGCWSTELQAIATKRSPAICWKNSAPAALKDGSGGRPSLPGSSAG
jgi:hypothetical protein